MPACRRLHRFISSSEERKNEKKKGETISAVLVETECFTKWDRVDRNATIGTATTSDFSAFVIPDSIAAFVHSSLRL
jgi:hypothetical protein